MKTFYTTLFSILFCTSVFSQNCNLICNGNFDSTAIATTVSQVSIVPCWNTTASDGLFEVWGTGFNGVPSYNGTQFIELNANVQSTLYQDFNVPAGTLLSIGFAHRGRSGVDTMEVSVGPVGGPYTSLGKWGDGNTAWGYYTSSYTSATAGSHRIQFKSIYSTGGNIAIGNFLDAVSVRGVTSFTVANNRICAGATLSLSPAVSSPTYTWTGPNGFVSNLQNPTIPNATPLATGLYYLNLAAGCGASATSITVVPQPTIAIFNVTGSQSITCNTPTVDLAVVSTYPGNLNYFWSSNTFTANTQTITVVSQSTLITITANDPITGCSATATTSVKVNTTVPVSSVGPINQIVNCGPGVAATATGVAISPTVNVSHYWYFPCAPLPQINGGQISIAAPGICSTGTLVNGTSTFVLIDNINGCSTTKTVQVVSSGGNYPSFAVASFSSTNTFTLGCSTKSVTDVNIINAQTNPQGGAISYTVLPPGFSGTSYTTSTVSAYTVNSPGTYTVIVKDNVNQCETRIPLSVIQNTFGPTLASSSITRTLSCSVPSVVLVGSSTTQNVTYNWKTNSLPPTVLNDTLVVKTTTAGASVPSATLIDTYTLTIRDEGNLCTTTTLVPMWQNTRPPKANIAISNPALTCIVFSVNLTNNSSTGILPGTFFTTQNIVSTLWEGPTPQQPLNNSSTYLGFTAGVYTMTARDLNNGCSAITTTVVGDNRLFPVLSTNSLVALDCNASTTGGVKLAVTALNLTPAALTVQWDVPVPTPNISNPNTLTLTTDGIGEYTLTVTTNSNGCKSTTKVKVVQGVLNANFTADPLTGYAPLTVNFTNNSSSTSSVSGTSSITSVWSFGNGTTRTTTVNTVNAGTSAVYNQAGTYTVTMFASKGACVDTFVNVIKVDIPSKLEVPNVFTPNGDNNNDLFFVRTANLSEITAMIYDRWGNKIYELTTEKGNIAWDGKNQAGKEVPDGTYFYVIKATGRDGQSYDTKGTVSLYR